MTGPVFIVTSRTGLFEPAARHRAPVRALGSSRQLVMELPSVRPGAPVTWLDADEVSRRYEERIHPAQAGQTVEGGTP